MSYKRIKTIAAATFVQGTVTCTYDNLCTHFGNPDIPQFGKNQKIQGEWLLNFKTVGMVRINDWKQSKTCLGEDLGKELSEITEWQVSGLDNSSQNAVEIVNIVLAGNYPN
jgi:hypothetical protein